MSGHFCPFLQSGYIDPFETYMRTLPMAALRGTMSNSFVVLRRGREDGQGVKVVRNAEDLLQGIFGRGVAITVNNVPVLQPGKSGKFLLAKRDFPLDPAIATARTEAYHG